MSKYDFERLKPSADQVAWMKAEEEKMQKMQIAAERASLNERIRREKMGDEAYRATSRTMFARELQRLENMHDDDCPGGFVEVERFWVDDNARMQLMYNCPQCRVSAGIEMVREVAEAAGFSAPEDEA